MDDRLDKIFFKLILISLCLLPWAFSSTCTLEGCSVCLDSTTCSSCSSGYYTKDGKTCTKITCIENCDKCSTTQSCMTCISGFQLYNSKCIRYTCSAQNCESCSGFTVDANTKELGSSTCGVCKKGYYLSNGNCKACPSGCKICEVSSYPLTLTCLECSDSSASRDKCMTCDLQDCITCENADYTRCKKCKEGYGLSYGQCHRCEDSNCTECEANNLQKCNVCIQGLVLNKDNKCTQCNSLCKECDASDNTKCLKCRDGTVFNNNHCEYCEGLGSCKECEIANSNNKICKQCIENYFLENQGCKRCDYRCKECESTTNCKICYDWNILMFGMCYDRVLVGVISGSILYFLICVIGTCCLARKCRNDMEKAKLALTEAKKTEIKEVFEEFYGKKMTEIEDLITRKIDKEKSIFVEEITKANKETTIDPNQPETINPNEVTKEEIIYLNSNKVNNEQTESNEDSSLYKMIPHAKTDKIRVYDKDLLIEVAKSERAEKKMR